MLRKVEIIVRGEGFIPDQVQSTIADMIRDYLIEQGILVMEPQQHDLFDC